MERFVEEHSELLDRVTCETEVTSGYPVVTLADYIDDHDIDVLMMGTVGRSDIGDMLMGSVASGIVKKMPCTVVLTPPPQD